MSAKWNADIQLTYLSAAKCFMKHGGSAVNTGKEQGA
jgi:hypothetical protein